MAGWALGVVEEDEAEVLAGPPLLADSPVLEELSVVEELPVLAPEESLDAVEAPAVEESVE